MARSHSEPQNQSSKKQWNGGGSNGNIKGSRFKLMGIFLQP
jgi:hypothetical protein